MTDQRTDHEVVAGVDTHRDTHHVAVIDGVGRPIADAAFPATAAGYDALISWLGSHGRVSAAGVEGTGSYGAELTRRLIRAQITVIEVDRPDRKTRRAKGKSDPVDAYAAAHAVLAGRAAGIPKTRTGVVEAIRALAIARRSAVQSRTQAMNQLRGLLVTAPEPLRAPTRGLTETKLIGHCARLRPGPNTADPTNATKYALRSLARRWLELTAEIRDLDTQLATLTTQAAPALVATYGVGPEAAAQLLIAAGDNPDRLHNEAAFAHLCGTAPIPASSGTTHRHRLNRGGHRHANRALHMIALTRARHDPRTRAYIQRRRTEGKTTKEIIRCLKRYIAREIYRTLTHPHPLDVP